jgi:hypothetical protein
VKNTLINMPPKNPEKWTKLPDENTILKTINAIKQRGINVILLNKKEEAFEKLKQMIPSGSEVMTGSSTTLYQIGFMDYYIQGKSPWKALGPMVFNEKDPIKQANLRRTSDASEYFVASINAICQTGELVAVDKTGSRVSAFPFVAKNLILVAGIQKITANLNEAMQRIREYVFFLEDDRAQKAYKMGSGFGKWVIIENEFIPNRTTLLLVKEALGF